MPKHATSKSILARAFDYPYPRPGGSYLFDGTSTPAALPQQPLSSLLTYGGQKRRFVLAIGSNGAPEQLARKFDAATDMDIPVVAVRVRSLDVVYAPLVAPYGSVPATVCASEGTVLHACANLLTEAQLCVMHASEGAGYAFVRLLQPEVVMVESGERVEGDVFCYVARGGVLHDEKGWPMAVEEMVAEGRLFRGVGQRGVQNYWKGVLDGLMVGVVNESVEESVVRCVRDSARRARVAEFIRERGIDAGGEGVWWEEVDDGDT